ncbi:MAG: T9SS type A sorting domain-containing protein [Ignavibacteria bacterium]|nr:T9SS type A sorting domain-containing protein [Ignavibacteria bacterium]
MKYLLIAVSLLLISCTTTQSPDGPSVQGRGEFEQLKYRDLDQGAIPEGMRERELQFATTLQQSVLGSKNVEDVQAYGEWKSNGPWNIGGRTRAGAFDVRNPKTIIIGAVSGGIWRSTNEGGSWLLQTKSEQLHSVACLAQDTRQGHEDTWYAGTGEIYGNSAQISGNGILKSTDNGITWKPLASTVSANTPASHQFAYTWCILVHPLRDTEAVFIATARSGIYRSTDGGSTWKSTISSNALFSEIIVTPNGTLYAAFSGYTGTVGAVSSRWGVFRSTDGVTWANVTPPDMQSDVKRIVIASIPQSPDGVYVLAETPGKGAKGSTLYRGEERFEWHSLWRYGYGATPPGEWTNLSANLPLTNEQRGDFYSQGGYDLLVKVSPHDPNVVVVGGTNLYVSVDGFTTPNKWNWIGGYWKPTPSFDKYTSYVNHHPDQHDVIFHPTNERSMLSLNDGGIYRTDDVRAEDVVWTDLNRGYITTQFYTIDMEQSDRSQRIVGGMQDNSVWITSTDSTEAFWKRIGGGDGAYSYFADAGKTLFYSSQQGRVYRVTYNDDGSEKDRTRIDPIGPKDYLFINPYVVHPADQHVVYVAGGNKLWRNNDVQAIPKGNSDSTLVGWDSLSATDVGVNQISCVAPSVTADGKHHRIYYGTTNGKIFVLDTAEVGNPTPRDITWSTMRSGGYVNSITIDQRDSKHLVACFSNYGLVSIWETIDAGTTWQAIAGNLEEAPSGSGNGPAVNWVGIVPFDATSNILVAATSTGLYFTPSTNGMSTVWTPTAIGELGNVPCDMVVTRVSDKRIAVASHGRGVLVGAITTLPEKPGTATLVSPSDTKRGILTDTVLTWNAAPSAVSYIVRLSSEGRPELGKTIQGVTDTKVAVTGLAQGPITYTWNVEPYGGGGAGQVSQTWSFSTAVRPPALLQPVNGAKDITQALLTWEHVPSAETYGIEVSPNAAFNPVLVHVDNHTDTSILVRGLDMNKRYFWRVRSANADATGVYSERSSFVTGVLSSVANVEDSGMLQPNPATTSCTVHLSNLAGSSIMVYSSSGALVRSMNAVSDEHEIDLQGIAAGSYTVVVKANGRTRITYSLTKIQ